jgi:hypothetical protein
LERTPGSISLECGLLFSLGRRATAMSSDSDVATATEVMTVYMALDGGLHHTRCNQRLSLHGQRAGLELDFYCLTCTESVTIPFCVVERIPVADAAC